MQLFFFQVHCIFLEFLALLKMEPCFLHQRCCVLYAAGRAVCQRATEERRAERCKKVQSGILAPELIRARWYPSLNLAACKQQRQCGRAAEVKEREMGIGADRPWFWAISQCRGLTPVSSQGPHSHSLTPGHPPPTCFWWDGEGKKAELVGWDKNSLITKVKYNTNNNNNEKE
ncbi:uncharacterized protein WM294_003282 isoform 2-T4 [Sarcoramphus papa]